MSSRRQRSIPIGGRYRQVSLYSGQSTLSTRYEIWHLTMLINLEQNPSDCHQIDIDPTTKYRIDIYLMSFMWSWYSGQSTLSTRYEIWHLTMLIHLEQYPSDCHRLDIDPTLKYRIDIYLMSIRGSLLSGLNAPFCCQLFYMEALKRSKGTI